MDLCDFSVNYSGVSLLVHVSLVQLQDSYHIAKQSLSHKNSIQSRKVFMAILIIFSDGKSTILQLLALQVMISYILHSVFLRACK